VDNFSEREVGAGGSRGDGGAALREFRFSDLPVRTVLRDGEPWIVATDVCAVLGHSSPARAIKRLDEDEKGVTTIHTLGGRQELIIVSESGLYALLLTSRKPQARMFSRWVRSEVLPMIRRTGFYVPRPVEYLQGGVEAIGSAMGSLPISSIPLTFMEFCDLHGQWMEHGYGPKSRVESEGELRRWLSSRDLGAAAGRHPSKGEWVYIQSVMELWWRESGHRFAASYVPV
jgi:hypothetical protein